MINFISKTLKTLKRQYHEVFLFLSEMGIKKNIAQINQSRGQNFITKTLISSLLRINLQNRS